MECVLFEKRLCFKPKHIHFVYSFLAYVAFSSCLRREDQFVLAVFFFQEEHEDMPLSPPPRERAEIEPTRVLLG